MSIRRQSHAIVRSLHMGYAAGTRLASHEHDWPQLVYASSGVMTVQTGDGAWVVPPERALWVPAGAAHAIVMAGRVTMRTLYLAPTLVAGRLPERPAVVPVPALLRELILHVVAKGRLTSDAGAERRLAGVLVDLLATTPAAPLELRTPRDPRGRRAAERMRHAGGLDLALDALASEVGASRRTLERIFARETGLTLGRWRRKARLLGALERLAGGASIAEVACAVGYASPSAFIESFREHLGTTPGRYFTAPTRYPAQR